MVYLDFGYCNLSVLTKSDFSRLNALLLCSVDLNTAPFLSMVLRQAVMLAKNGMNFLLNPDQAHKMPQFFNVLGQLQSLCSGNLFWQWLHASGSYKITQIVDFTFVKCTFAAFYLQVHIL